MHVDEEVQDLAASSKLNAEWGYLRELFDRGRRWADLWLRDHFDSIGKASTFDVEELFEKPAARPAELPPALEELSYQSAMRSPPTNWALLAVYSKSSILTPFGSVIQACQVSSQANFLSVTGTPRDLMWATASSMRLDLEAEVVDGVPVGVFRLGLEEDLDVAAAAGAEVEAVPLALAVEVEDDLHAEDVAVEVAGLGEVVGEDADVRELLRPDRHGLPPCCRQG